MTTPSLIDLSARGYTVQRWIGHWFHSWGDVFVARRNDATDHVIREIRCELLKDTDEIVHEVVMLRSLRHPRILECSACFIHEQSLYIVTPCFSYGSISDVMEAAYPLGLPEKACSSIAYQTLKALQYLHDKGVVHRGIRGSHLLVDHYGKVTLSGFRCSIYLPDGRGKTAEFERDLATMLQWLAPEVIRQDLSGYDQRSDIYSLGITLLELANSVVPYKDSEPLKMLYEKGIGCCPRLFDSRTVNENTIGAVEEHARRTFSLHFHDFVAICLRAEQLTRPTAHEIISHHFPRSKRKNLLKYLPDALSLFDTQRESTRGSLNILEPTECPAWR